MTVINLEPIEIIVEDHTTVNPINVEISGVYLPGSALGGASSFTHTQDTPAVEWSAPHSFGSEPASVLLKNADGDVLIPHFAEYSSVRVVLLFNLPTAGTLRIWKG